MDNWQATFLGLKQLPRELTAFEIEAFFTFTLAERQVIEDRRRLRDGLVEMPDMHWWHPGYDCPDFGLSEFNGQVTDASRFECRVIDAQVAWAKPYRTWNSEGRTAGGANDFFDDIPTVSYELHDDILLIKWPL